MLRTLTGLTLTGPNAIRALEAMGLLNAVLGKIPPGSLSSKGFLFYSGVGGQELVYDVRTGVSPEAELPGQAVNPFAHVTARSTRPLQKMRVSACTGELSGITSRRYLPCNTLNGSTASLPTGPCSSTH